MTLDLSRTHCLGEALRDALLTYKSNDALLEMDRHRESARYDYTQLRREAERLSTLLRQAGVQPGGRCAILMSNQSKWVVSSLAALWAGATLVPLDYKLTPIEQARLVAHARPQALIVEYPAWRALIEEGGGAPELPLVLVSEAPDGAALGAARRFESDVEGAFVFVFVPRTRQDVAAVVYSSGTSGAPKGCMLTHDAYLEQAQVLARMFPMQESDRYFSVLPTNHAIDFMCGTVIPFLYGAAVVHQRTLRAEFLAPTMKRYGVTHTALVPRILRTLRDRITEQLDELPAWQRRTIDALADANELVTMRTPRQFVSSTLLRPLHERFGGKLRMIFAGGAYVEPELAEFFYRLGFPVAIGYGLTEACTVLTVNDLRPFRATTVGRPVAGVELELRDVGTDGIGEVYARSRTLMSGYLDAPELTAEALTDGWLRTGDLGAVDASGHLRLVGRRKNMIVTEGGKNVYPEDVEAAFEGLPCEELCIFASRMLGAAAAGLSKDAERLTMVIRPRKDVTMATLRAAVAERNLKLVDYKRVASYLMWDREFPRTASMKVKRELLAEEVRAAARAPELLSAS